MRFAMIGVFIGLAACGSQSRGDDAPDDGTRCGDGTIDSSEGCDDGNTVGGDGCRADCEGAEVCGDGLIDPGEACDDANTLDGDACGATCQPTTCGDGIAMPGELCFGPVATFSIGVAAVGGTTGDLDGDGNVDAVAISSSRRISIAFGDGAGRLGSPLTLPIVPTDARKVFAFDADLDGDLDLTVACAGSGDDGALALLLNDGSGRSFETVKATLPSWTRWAAAADLDGDGDRDVVVQTYHPEPLLIVAINERDHFELGTPIANPSSDSAYPVFADFDRDGDLDLAVLRAIEVSGKGAVDVWVNNGGGLSAGPSTAIPEADALFLVDANGDEQADLLAIGDSATQNALLINAGGGMFTPQLSPQTSVEDAVVGDLDRDGDLDLVSVSPTFGNGYVRYNDGAFRFPAASSIGAVSGAVQPSLVDVDHDAALDLVVSGGAYSYGPNRTHVATNAGGKLVRVDKMASGTMPPVEMVATQLVPGGSEEFVTIESYTTLEEAELVVYARMPSTRQLTRRAIAIYRNLTGLAIGDVTGDGKLDAVVATNADSLYDLRVYPGDGAGGFGSPQIVAMTKDTKQLALADIDGNGTLDAVLMHYNALAIARTTAGVLAAPTVTTTIMQPDLLTFALGDIDGDGDVDIVAGTRGGVVVQVNSGGTFTARPPLTGLRGTHLAAVDFDRDGDLDFAAYSSDGNGKPDVGLLRNTNGTFTFESVESDIEIAAFCTGDFDGDTMPDLIGTSLADYSDLRLFRNTAGGVAKAVAALPVGRRPIDCAVTDVDGDGLVDLVAANYETRDISVLWGYR